MTFWGSGCTPSTEHSYLKDVYRIPDYVTSVENVFCVKHGFFSWTIINLSDFPEARLGVVFCQSPLFRLLQTTWCLQLCPKANINGQRGISLRLMRGASNLGPENVLASYRLGVGQLSNNIWFEAKESTFRKGSFIQLNTSVLGYLEDFFTDGVDGASVLCEIYVSYLPTMSKERAWEVSEIDSSLPADMSALLTSNHSMNVLIEIRGHQIGAHKSVLSARSKTLDSRLNHANFVQLSCSILCLKCILSYMYTGSFDYLARNAYFSIGLYEMADELSLLPLRDLLYPDKKSNKSRIHIKSIEDVYSTQFHAWSFISDTTLKIPTCISKNSGLRMSILVYKIGPLPNYCAAFKLQISGIAGGFHGETSLSLLNRYRKGLTARFLSQELSPAGSALTAIFVLTAADFQSCDVMASDSISVKVAIKVYQMRHDRFRNFGIQKRSYKPLQPCCWVEKLAEDLKALLQFGHSSDASMIVGEQSFRVHRHILAARSPYFHSLFYGGNDASNVYLVTDVKLRTFQLMLNYIYCGTLTHFSDLTLEDFVELFKVSMNLGLSSLLGISSHVMKMMNGELDFVDLK